MINRFINTVGDGCVRGRLAQQGLVHKGLHLRPLLVRQLAMTLAGKDGKAESISDAEGFPDLWAS